MKQFKTVKQGYQNPAQYYQISATQKPLYGGDYNLKYGTMGLKVKRVQQALGLGNRWEQMDYTTINAVRRFQRAKGIPETGEVDLITWKALGYNEYDWYFLGAYKSPVRINVNSGRFGCIEAMIARAYEYLGTEYVVGASGEPGTGVDCSGLVMQALYAGGIDMGDINPVRHSQYGYEFESRNIYASSKFQHVPISQMQRGDLIFYQSRGTVIHVAIYLGDGNVIEAWPERVVIWPLRNSQRSDIAGVVRPFV